MEANEYRQVLVREIVVTRLQIRSNYDKKKGRELAHSVRQKGVMQGLVVRPYGRNKFELVFGSRRLRAAKRAKLERVPALIIKSISDKDAVVLAIHENMHRQELNPFEEARAILRLIRVYNMGIQEIAHEIGRHESFIKTRLKLLKMPQEVQEMVATKKLPFYQVDRLAMLPTSMQEEVAQNAAAHKFTARELQIHIQDVTGKSPRRKIGDSSDWTPEKIKLRIRDFTRFLGNIHPLILEMGPVDILNTRILLEDLSKQSDAMVDELRKFITV